MPDNGDDPSSSEDLIRKAKERLEGADEDSPTQEGPTEIQVEDELSLSEAVEDKPSEVQEEAVSRRTEDAPSGSRDSQTPTPPILPSTPPVLPSESHEMPWYRRGWVRIVGGVIFAAIVLFNQFGSDTSLPQVGECFNLPSGLEPGEDVDSFPVVSCSESHDGEVVGLVDLPYESSAPYPGEERIFSESYIACVPSYLSHVGVPAGQKFVDLNTYSPGEELWEDDDRTVLCTAERYDGEKTSTSVKGEGSLLPNNCWESPEDVVSVDCSERHTLESFASLVHPAGPDAGYPSEMESFAEQECLMRFEDFVGISFEDSIFDVTWLYPNPETWMLGDRVVICDLGQADGQPTTGTAEGSGK